MIPYEKRQEIIKKALGEIQFARDFKQSKTSNWKKNEDMYYGYKETPTESRANVNLNQMSSFVHTLLSKIDTPLTFKFSKRKPSQEKRAKFLNSLRDFDTQRDYWDIKDLTGKKQAIIYGRAIYSYYADSEKEYTPHLENIDVYNFLIDPSAGGIDIEKANYIGDYGVILSKSDIRAGIKSGKYLKTEGQNLLYGNGNSIEETQEVVNAKNRTYDTEVTKSNKNIGDPDIYHFWRWGTTYEGKRYYLLLTERGGTALVVKELTDVFESNMWWYWSWAAFLDLTEFWTPSYCDYVRELFMAQAVSINQMLDNAEQINKPQKVVNTGAMENLADLKYRRDGVIRVKRDFNVDQALQTIKVPSIDTPLKVFEMLQTISQGITGVSDIAAGASDPKGKATIYEGNQANEADRFGLLNKSYAFGYRRFAKLWEEGVKEHLVKKVAVDILGPTGVEVKRVSRRDIFKGDNDDFNLTVDASNAEIALTDGEKRTKLQFLTNITGNPAYPVNAQKSMEMQAEIVGFTVDEIRQLQDTSEFGDMAIMSEADRDIEMLLENEPTPLNQKATAAYLQRFVDFIQDNQEDINTQQFERLTAYMAQLEDVIAQNMVRRANQQLSKMATQQMQAGMPPPQQDMPVQQPQQQII